MNSKCSLINCPLTFIIGVKGQVIINTKEIWQIYLTPEMAPATPSQTSLIHGPQYFHFEEHCAKNMDQSFGAAEVKCGLLASARYKLGILLTGDLPTG